MDNFFYEWKILNIQYITRYIMVDKYLNKSLLFVFMAGN